MCRDRKWICIFDNRDDIMVMFSVENIDLRSQNRDSGSQNPAHNIVNIPVFSLERLAS